MQSILDKQSNTEEIPEIQQKEAVENKILQEIKKLNERIHSIEKN